MKLKDLYVATMASWPSWGHDS